MEYPRSLLRCRRCPRLHDHLKALRRELPDYWNRPVPASGDFGSPLLIVGLAPGRHGANRTGRPFTGDASGKLLFDTLDALGLHGRVMITNAVKCLPVDNRPTGTEVNNCRAFLGAEMAGSARVVLALGRIAHDAVLKSLNLRPAHYPFSHGAVRDLTGEGAGPRFLVDSYHCSRYNTQTGRLTSGMFREVVERAGMLAGLTG